MKHTQLIDELLQELSYRVGIVDIYNKEQQSVMSEILTEWGEFEAKETIFRFLNEDGEKRFKNPILNRKIKYTGKDGKEREGLVGNLITAPKDSPGRIEAEKLLPQDGTPERDAINQEIGSQGGGGPQDDTKGGGTDDVQQEKPQGTALKQGGYDKIVDKEEETRKKLDGEDVEVKQPKETEPVDGNDEQGDIAKTDSGRTLYSLGKGYYSDTPNGNPKYIRTESINELKAKNQKGETIQVQPISFEDLKKAANDYRNRKFPNFSEQTPDSIVKYLIGKKEDYKPISDTDFDDVRKDSRKDASTGQNAGKGGASTTAQEEAAGLAAEIALKNPDFTTEQIQEELEKQLLDWPIYKRNAKEVKRIASVSMGQVKIVKEIQDSENYGEQKDGYPKPITFTGKITNATANFLVTKLKEAKKSGDEEAIKHYEEELRAFAEYATSATGKEGDADTAFMYIDKNGRVRIDYITNKMSLGDMKLNTTKNVRAQNFVKNKVEGADVEKLNKIQEIISGEVEKMNQGAVEQMSFIREDLTLNESRKEIPGSVLDALYGRATFDASGKYKKSLESNKLVEEYLKRKFEKNFETATNEELLEACFAVIGQKGADGIGDSGNGAPGKVFIKMGDLWVDLDSKVQQQKNKGVEGDQIYKNIASITDKKTGKPLYGGVMSWEELKSFHENKTAKKMAAIRDSRGDSMKQAHADIVNDSKELDIKYLMSQGMTQQEAEERVNSTEQENGPNIETYVRTFMEEMHWTRIISGDADGRVHMSIGEYNVKPHHYRECLKDLTGYDGDIDTPEGREGLINHLAKFCKIRPGESSVEFVNYKTKKTVILGQDTWRSAGNSEKVEGKDGKDLQQCLKSKQK